MSGIWTLWASSVSPDQANEVAGQAHEVVDRYTEADSAAQPEGAGPGSTAQSGPAANSSAALPPGGSQPLRGGAWGASADAAPLPPAGAAPAPLASPGGLAFPEHFELPLAFICFGVAMLLASCTLVFCRHVGCRTNRASREAARQRRALAEREAAAELGRVGRSLEQQGGQSAESGRSAAPAKHYVGVEMPDGSLWTGVRPAGPAPGEPPGAGAEPLGDAAPAEKR